MSKRHTDRMPERKNLGSQRLRWLQLAAELQAIAGDDSGPGQDATRLPRVAAILARELVAMGLDLPLSPGEILTGSWAEYGGD